MQLVPCPRCGKEEKVAQISRPLRHLGKRPWKLFLDWQLESG
jgi:hypothetical protein